jgi:RNA polymerase-binding protein DksA
MPSAGQKGRNTVAKTSKTSSARKPAPKAKSGPSKPAPRKPEPRKPEAKGGKKPEVKKPEPKKPEPAKAGARSAATPAPAALNAAGNKIAPKGITIVANKPLKRPKPKKLEMPISEPLIKPGGPKWKPLIPSGPKAPPTGLVGHDHAAANAEISQKVRLSKKELDKYREILMQKRAELAGDINNIEDEALRQSSGSLSSLPQHMAEQGSDTFEQSISLDLAQVDRDLIRKIDEALARIEDGTYGVCLRTGQRISAERLAELPWAKYSIEAQREMERRPHSRAE